MLRLITMSSLLAHASFASLSTAMKPVKIVVGRVVGDKPEWDQEHQTWVSSFGKDFDSKYRATFDSVNAASVEGALLYVQAEAINVQDNKDCKRKANVNYITFSEIEIAQTKKSLQYYKDDARALPEYGPFMPMDGGQCTPPQDDSILTDECNVLFGGDGKKDIGPCVGASLKETEPTAPYPGAVWYSFPNSCVMQKWKDKTDSCRADFPGGLCPYGTSPDGVKCTFSFKMLGYVLLDDVVGISQMKHSSTGKYYKNYTEFCQDKENEFGGVEFQLKPETRDVEAIPFWLDPFTPEANQVRTQRVVYMYNQKANFDKTTKALPTIDELTASNPPCYENVKKCSREDAPYGCRRDHYAQYCHVCTLYDEGCTVAPKAGSLRNKGLAVGLRKKEKGKSSRE